MQYQKLILVGNVGREPEQRYTPGSDAVTTFSMAVNRKWSGGEETTWFRVTCWRKLAETVAEWVHVGQEVLVEGILKPDERGNPRVWQANDGTYRASFEVTANTVQFGKHAEYIKGDGPEEAETEEREEIPF